jgi:hypothetical protein
MVFYIKSSNARLGMKQMDNDIKKSLILGVSLILAAAAHASIATPRYQIAVTERIAYRLDTRSGQLSYCPLSPCQPLTEGE